jgi:lysophospholipase L1-like esterase
MKLRKNWFRYLVVMIPLFGILFLSLKYREQIHQKYIVWTNSVEIILFGDSHIANGKWSSFLDNNGVLKLGWGGYTSEQLVDKIVICSDFNPKYVFILCGGNDIYDDTFTVENTVNNLKLMADKLREDNIVPVFQKLMYQHNNPKFNLTIDSINTELSKYCLKEQIEIIDTGKNMYDSNGLKASLTYDNLHLNEKGYAIWSEEINKYLKSK